MGNYDLNIILVYIDKYRLILYLGFNIFLIKYWIGNLGEIYVMYIVVFI